MARIKRYKNKPKIIKACQWHKMGDYPVEGVVAPFDHDKIEVYGTLCSRCDQPWKAHGGMDTLEGYHRVCPTDYVCTGIEGELYPCKASVFEASYDEIEVNTEAWTAYPFTILGDTIGVIAPSRVVTLHDYDEKKSCRIFVQGHFETVKIGYLFRDMELTKAVTHEDACELNERFK